MSLTGNKNENAINNEGVERRNFGSEIQGSHKPCPNISFPGQTKWFDLV